MADVKMHLLVFGHGIKFGGTRKNYPDKFGRIRVIPWNRKFACLVERASSVVTPL